MDYDAARRVLHSYVQQTVLAKQMEQLGRVHGTPWMPWQHSLRGTIKSAPFFFTKNLNVTKLVYSLYRILNFVPPKGSPLRLFTQTEFNMR